MGRTLRFTHLLPGLVDTLGQQAGFSPTGRGNGHHSPFSGGQRSQKCFLQNRESNASLINLSVSTKAPAPVTVKEASSDGRRRTPIGRRYRGRGASLCPCRGNEKEFRGNGCSEILRLRGNGLFRTVSRFSMWFSRGKEKGSCSPPGVCLSPSSEQEAFSKWGRRGSLPQTQSHTVAKRNGHLAPCYSNCGPWTGDITFPGEPVRNSESQAPVACLSTRSWGVHVHIKV